MDVEAVMIANSALREECGNVGNLECTSEGELFY